MMTERGAEMRLVADRLSVDPCGPNLITVRFVAWGCSGEIVLPLMNRHAALAIATAAAEEVWRIERKYPHYSKCKDIAHVDVREGAANTLDGETTSLLEYSRRCREASAELLCASSRVTRRAANENGLAREVECDLTSVARDYAVDRACELLAWRDWAPCLVKLGSRWRAHRTPSQGVWQIENESPDANPVGGKPLRLDQGALATSAPSARQSKSGLRVERATLARRWGTPVGPRFITVAADTCQKAGFLSSVALLHGPGAHRFLQEEGHRYWFG